METLFVIQRRVVFAVIVAVVVHLFHFHRGRKKRRRRRRRKILLVRGFDNGMDFSPTTTKRNILVHDKNGAYPYKIKKERREIRGIHYIIIIRNNNEVISRWMDIITQY